jgi:hypothetical protein
MRDFVIHNERRRFYGQKGGVQEWNSVGAVENKRESAVIRAKKKSLTKKP